MNTAIALTADAFVPEKGSSYPAAIRPRPRPHLRLIAAHGRLLPDDKGNQTTVNYDNLGRRLGIANPDTGETTFTYDPASNLIEKATAKQKHARGQVFPLAHLPILQ